MEQPKKDKNPKNQLSKVWPPKFNIIWIYIVLLGAIAFMWNSYDGGEPLKSEWLDVKEQMALKGDVEKIIFISNEQKAESLLKRIAFLSIKSNLEVRSQSLGHTFTLKYRLTLTPKNNLN